MNDKPEKNIIETGDQAKKKNFWLFLNIFFFIISMVLVFAIFKIAQGDQVFVNNESDSLLTELSKRLFSQEQHVGSTEAQHEIRKTQRNIDGAMVEEGKENITPLAMMIENHLDSRPPAGLSKANLVIEAEAEGGVTRFLAVYADEGAIDRIGPIRSARSYYLDWAKEFGGAYVHCGGSPEALERINNENILDINEFYKEKLFWRDVSRFAPHNVYTSTTKLRGYLAEKNTASSTYAGWSYKDDLSSDLRSSVQQIEIKYWLPGYEVSWRYASSTNDYTRYLAGDKHQDENGDSMIAKNLIIQVIPAQVVDEYKRLQMDVIGTGKATVCLDGACLDAKWQKNSSAARTRFYDSNNEEIEFNRGTTWVEAIRPGVEMSIKN